MLKTKYFKNGNRGLRRIVTALHVKFDVVVIKNEKALFTYY